ncbi:MAG: F0F1 ATP synthase subunit A [Defluviitaleaceae bacterium]|nr:F0F1 ATP synthase subunit A [Defluviitaleaceae bacterium]
MVNFDIRTYRVFEVFGIEIWFTETIRNTWIIMGVLILFAIFARIKFFKNVSDVPSGFQNGIEALVEMFDNFVVGITGKRYHYLGKWFFGVIVFIGISNISGMFLLRPPTADISTTLALAIATFFLIHGLGVKSAPLKYLKSFLEPFFLFLPINLVSAIATPISLAFRLFGNVIAGVVITGLVYNLMPYIATLAWPGFLHVYFDLFAGLLHAYIFTVLSLSFIMDKIPQEN